MPRSGLEEKIRVLAEHAWDHEVKWPDIEAWSQNFCGTVTDKEAEQLHALFALSRFMYFGRRLTREMLKALYRDHFKAPLMQRIRRNHGGTKDVDLLKRLYDQELSSTRFLGVGNPAESGAHLLYFFRQINHLKKDLFLDISGAFSPKVVITQSEPKISLAPRSAGVSRYVFFDDLVGSGSQAKRYLSSYLKNIRRENSRIELKFICLFSTSSGLARLNEKDMFDGNAISLFELDETYRAFDSASRYFAGAPSWFSSEQLRDIAREYGIKIQPKQALGYKDGQLLIGFSHNTPDNTLPIFWDEGRTHPWSPIFIRYDKVYG